jgi:hypothetical protein
MSARGPALTIWAWHQVGSCLGVRQTCRRRSRKGSPWPRAAVASIRRPPKRPGEKHEGEVDPDRLPHRWSGTILSSLQQHPLAIAADRASRCWPERVVSNEFQELSAMHSDQRLTMHCASRRKTVVFQFRILSCPQDAPGSCFVRGRLRGACNFRTSSVSVV